MAVSVRCEARRPNGRCPNGVAVYRHRWGESYGLCTFHSQLSASHVQLDPPLDFESLQNAYREAHPRAKGA